MAKKLVLAKVDTKGNLVPLSLIAWAQAFNEAHALTKPKVAK